MTSKVRALAQVTLIYAGLAGVGVAAYVGWPGSESARFFAADIAMTVGCYLVSVVKRNSSLYDPYWSVIPFFFVGGFFLSGGAEAWDLTDSAVAVLVSLWSWRLTFNWARGWPGWEHEDWRYVDFRVAHGRWFQFTNFFGIQLFPTVLVFAGCVPLFWVFGGERVHPELLVLGLCIGLLGTLLEHIADNQLAAFKGRESPLPGDILDTGLWGAMRYPNYLGEMLFWWGLALCGLGAGGPTWVVSGAVAMVVLFVVVSIPLKDKRMRRGRPTFEAYRARVPALFPRLGRG